MCCRSRPIFWGCLFFILSFPSYAQDLEVGISGGGAYYLGDLNPGKHFQNTQLSYGALVRCNIDTRWAVKLAVMRGLVKGNASQGTPFIQSLGLAFTSNITDISGVAEFNFFPYFTGSERNRISPYLYAGISVFFFNPYINDSVFGKQFLKDWGTEGQNISDLGTKNYSTIGFSIPFGIGVKVSLSERLGLQVFWEMHKTFTDHLDDVSSTYYLTREQIGTEYKYFYQYPDPSREGVFIKKEFTNADAQTLVLGATAEDFYRISDPTQTHASRMERGDPATKDWFSFFGLSLCYKFNLPGSKKCKDLNH